ncbi:acetolactate synthase [Aeromicrobium duanguangcaii]|uniref:Acetolactate synthase n=1 Tax=Aeromicrobium duanguangcaii TaxID=2968086 RepID=A0ABY5KB57_9ACTN|nr:acetolactate synthase [Aeromicrobium duanguangcaii]MCD9154894.1 acetolactate synthase [Aeromicrobium duanguangcaii]UUI67696.1 acetolactate synthase [Aeromicrobium duanguangcaii]
MTEDHTPEGSLPEPTGPHGGHHALDVARAHGAEAMFTLSGAHIFPMYDAAVKSEQPMPIIDVRHEPSAVFAAEAIGKLTRTPGLAVLTAGPGVTNGVSPVAQAFFSGSPLVVVGGRAAASTWGTGTLQELDHPPIFETITKHATTASTLADIAPVVDQAFTLAGSSHRGPTFVDIPMDEFFNSGPVQHASAGPGTTRLEPDPEAVSKVVGLLSGAQRPVVILGTDVWSDHAEEAALRFVEETGIPAIANGMGRGIVPGGHGNLVTRARSRALGTADVVVVVGTPLDFRLGFGRFGGKDGASPAVTVHVADSPDQVSAHAALGASVAGDLSLVFDGLLAGLQTGAGKPDWSPWLSELQDIVAATVERDSALLTAEADPIHPARIYGELLPRLADDAVVIGDGGDFVSFAGKFVEPQRPGGWLDPGPYGCLGAGLGAAMAARIARPSSQIVLLMGDGAAGMSIIDIDTLVRHNLPVVIVVGNNSAWGLEKPPMQMLYGYDVAADLAPNTRYDQVAQALGAGGEFVTDPKEIGPALDRAFASGVPYLVNIATDVNALYPRTTMGI